MSALVEFRMTIECAVRCCWLAFHSVSHRHHVLYLMHMHLIKDALYQEGSVLLINNTCLIKNTCLIAIKVRLITRVYGTLTVCHFTWERAKLSAIYSHWQQTTWVYTQRTAKCCDACQHKYPRVYTQPIRYLLLTLYMCVRACVHMQDIKFGAGHRKLLKTLPRTIQVKYNKKTRKSEKYYFKMTDRHVHEHIFLSQAQRGLEAST